MATKKELEEEVKKLKQIVRALRSEVKNSEDSVEGLNDKAFTVLGKKIITINYDLEKNSAIITDIIEESGDIVAEYKMEQKQKLYFRGVTKWLAQQT